MLSIRKGRGVKKWSKLPTNSTTNLPTWGRGMSKIVKNCQQRLWMVPYVMKFLLYKRKFNHWPVQSSGHAEV